jgi:hypothetical protein
MPLSRRLEQVLEEREEYNVYILNLQCNMARRWVKFKILGSQNKKFLLIGYLGKGDDKERYGGWSPGLWLA